MEPLLVTKQLAVNTGPGDLPGNLAAGGALHRPALGCCGVSPGQLAVRAEGEMGPGNAFREPGLLLPRLQPFSKF